MRRSGTAAGGEGEETRAVLFISPGCGAASARVFFVVKPGGHGSLVWVLFADVVTEVRFLTRIRAKTRISTDISRITTDTLRGRSAGYADRSHRYE